MENETTITPTAATFTKLVAIEIRNAPHELIDELYQWMRENECWDYFTILAAPGYRRALYSLKNAEKLREWLWSKGCPVEIES